MYPITQSPILFKASWTKNYNMDFIKGSGKNLDFNVSTAWHSKKLHKKYTEYSSFAALVFLLFRNYNCWVANQ